jgi:D-alanine-D-alanine ligase
VDESQRKSVAVGDTGEDTGTTDAPGETRGERLLHANASENSGRAPTRRARRSSRPVRVAIIHNVDYGSMSDRWADSIAIDVGNDARAEVASTADEVRESLDDEGHVVTIIPVDGDLWQMRDELLTFEADVVFNLCESVSGDARLESAVPMVLEGMGIPYTGSPASALSSALYKDRVKTILARAGVPTPEAQVFFTKGCTPHLQFPAIVKPTREDGSIGIRSDSVVHDADACRAKVDRILQDLNQPVLVERFIKGREFNVAFVGYPAARILPLSEIDFGQLPTDLPPIVSYEAKWREGSPEDLGTVPVTFPQLPSAVAARIRRVATEAFRAIGVRDYGRVDIRLCDDTGTPYVVDVNPNCDLSRNAGLARAANTVGIDHRAFMRLLVRYALRRKRDLATVAERSGAQRVLFQ